MSFKRKPSGREVVRLLHGRIVEISRDPRLYGAVGLPDTVEGRFEALTLHVLLVLRRLRQLPAPAADVAQDLVDTVFEHLEIALRELGVGDFGVPKRMKKLARAFYDRTARYDRLLDGGNAAALAGEIAEHLAVGSRSLEPFARRILAGEAVLLEYDLEGILRDLRFGDAQLVARDEAEA